MRGISMTLVLEWRCQPAPTMSASHPAKISVKLRELNQLFNSMDPSPFLDRDLDDDAEEFIVSSARELHGSHAFELAVHLGSHPDPGRAAVAEHAVQHYFSARAELKKREFRLLLRRGHSVLAVGLLFLTTCLVLSGLVTKLFPNQIGEILHEGLMIVGWVAMWRPLEIYLYDWWPLRQEWISLQRLAKMRVRLVCSQTKPVAAATEVATAGCSRGGVRLAETKTDRCLPNAAEQPGEMARKLDPDENPAT